MAVDSYTFGKIVIDGQAYTRDVILLPEGVQEGWWRQEGHQLAVDDLEAVYAADVDVLIVGTGFFGLVRVSSEVAQEIRGRGVELHVHPTPRACKLYNKWVAQQASRVAAALHLSC
jgi:hypothetical protein